MSEAQAIETEIPIETEEADQIEIQVEESNEAEAKKDEPKPIEIEVDGGGKPTPRRLSRFDKRMKKKSDEAEEAKARAKALEEENKLLRLAQQQKTLKEPDEDTFEGTEAEFKAAQRAYQQQEIKRIAAEEAQELVNKTLQQSQQANVESEQDSVIEAHYERAESMQVTNYHELESNAADIMGDDFVKAIILSSDNAHRLIASIGANPRKAAEIAQLAKSNPTKAFAQALTFEIHPSLSPASVTTPSPEQEVEPGSGVVYTKRGPPGAKFW